MRWYFSRGQYAGQVFASLKRGGETKYLRFPDTAALTDSFTVKETFGEIEMRAEVRLFGQYDALDWVLYLKNVGAADSLPLSDIRAADLSLDAQPKERFAYEGINGDTCSSENFLPFSKALVPGSRYEVTPAGGRPTDTSFPYFDLCDKNGGAVIAIGWSGQWMYTLERDEERLHLAIGVQDAEFYLMPGEEVRLNRVLVMGFTGDSTEAHVKFRRLMYAHFAPRTADGNLPTLPCAIQDFDRYVWTNKEWSTQSGQRKWIDCASKLGEIDTVWLDAAWFKGLFPYGVGNYSFRPGFPEGLRPSSDEARRRGMKYMLWFEPERVSYGSEVERAHPEWVMWLGNETRPELDKVRADDSVWQSTPSGLYNLGIPEAEEYLAGILIDFIKNQGIDIYREDFNIAPLPYWRKNDAPGRKGLSEIRFVMGFYRLWDDIRGAFPGILIDSCAGGGRRNDLEAMMRAVPLWRSDTGCSPITEDMPSDVWNQCQSMALSMYLPYHSIAVWNTNAYEFRSAATNGIAAQLDVFNDGFDFEDARRCLMEFKQTRDYWLGDFRPLTPITTDNTAWAAWYLDRPDRGDGIVYVFRRAQSPYSKAEFALAALDADSEYEIEILSEDRVKHAGSISGGVLNRKFMVELKDRRTSAVIKYRKKEA